MTNIESLLHYGIIRINSFNNSLVLIAAFFANGDKLPIKVSSDRGIDHLLLRLYEKVTLQETAIDSADVKYPSSLAIIGPSHHGHLYEKQRVLERSLTEFSCNDHVFSVVIRQHFAPYITADPGEYVKRGTGTCLNNALMDALNAEPVLQH